MALINGIRTWLSAAPLAALALLLAPPRPAKAEVTFERIPTQFIAALAEPSATSGTGAETWGLWTVDPGPRGVRLKYFSILRTVGVAPAGWSFDENDWWLDENGLIMEQPTYGLAPGKYLVTGNRDTTAVLTIHPKDATGSQRWELDKTATIYDVTHLKCRSARYRPAAAGSVCTPANVRRDIFPIGPVEVMPPVAGCTKLDYTVLFIIGRAVGE